MIWVIIGLAIIAFGVVLFLLSRRGTPDGVASFRRQIDALSPEARRPVVDQVQQLEEQQGRTADQPPDGDDQPGSNGNGDGADGP